MGPLLFLLYINDIINCLEDPNDAELVLYADDTNIFVISNDRSSAVTKANDVLNNINNSSSLIKTSNGKRAFQHFAPILWNNLPSEIKCIQDISLFKKRLKTYLFGISYQDYD